MRERLKEIVENNGTRSGKLFDMIVQLLVLISLISFSLSTLPNLTPVQYQLFNLVELICVLLFSIEYLLRIYVADNPFRYIFSFYGIIDLIGILPFYINSVVDLRTIRVFRILRIFRTFKLVRYNKALRRFSVAFKIIKEEIILFGIVSGIMIYLSAVGIYFFEHDAQPTVFSSVFDSLWWSTITLTTVGYGDVYPITTGGRMFTFFVLIIGVGIVTIPAGLVASALSKAREMDQRNKKKKKAQLKNRQNKKR